MCEKGIPLSREKAKIIREVEVNELGNIVLQQQLQIHVAGLTTAQIEEKIGQVVVEKGYLQPKGNGNPVRSCHQTPKSTTRCRPLF